MTDYLLFIDTEASGLPKKWKLPYSAKDNWPFSVQISWLIYTKQGLKVKQEDHYIKETELKITKSAIAIHGINQSFLHENGQNRHDVIKIFSDDVAKYRPLIIGHFMEFDYHMLGMDFYRTGIENPVKKENTFCTMRATMHLVKNPVQKFLKLGELFEALFNTALKNQHNALVDARATAECFFELVKRAEISDDTIKNQQKEIRKTYDENKGSGCIMSMLLIISSFILIFYSL